MSENPAIRRDISPRRRFSGAKVQLFSDICKKKVYFSVNYGIFCSISIKKRTSRCAMSFMSPLFYAVEASDLFISNYKSFGHVFQELLIRC